MMNKPSKWDYAAISACSVAAGLIFAALLLGLLLGGCATNPDPYAGSNDRHWDAVYGTEQFGTKVK